MQRIKEKFYKLLRWSEKYTKTDMVYLTHGGFWLTLGQIISLLSSFLLAIAFANLLPKETFGTYRYILSVAGILAISTLGGLNTAVTQAVARGFEGSLIPALKARIRWGLLGGLASLILAGYYYFQDNATLTISFLIAAVFMPFMDSFGIYNSLLQGRKLFNVSTKYGIISQIIAVAVLITTLFLTKNLFLILFAYFASWTLMRLIFFKITFKKFSPNPSQDPKTISYGKHLTLMVIITAIATQFDKLIIFHYLGAAQVAIYTMAIAPLEQIKGLFRNINVLAFPKFAQKTKEEIKNTITGKITKLLFLLLLVTVIYIILAPLLFKILFPKYTESIFYSQLFAVSLVFTASLFPYNIMQSQQMNKELYKFNFYTSIFQIASLYFLISFYGLTGIIIAMILSRFFGFILSIFFLKQH